MQANSRRHAVHRARPASAPVVGETTEQRIHRIGRGPMDQVAARALRLPVWPMTFTRTPSTMSKNDPVARSPIHLDHVDDQDLARLAVLWRVQALRGNPAAQPIAHALEAEQRRRYQSVFVSRQSPWTATPSRRWWKFW